jgi:hypothetical protein
VHSLQEITDHVLIYEHCRCLHELIKEIDFWFKKGQTGARPSFAKGPIFDSSITEEEEQIQMSTLIIKQIDFT